MKTKKTGKTMRVAGLLLALVLVTSCFVGGTFAKYVTSGHGNDSARAAMFGVTVTATGSDGVFAKEYDSDTNDYTGKTVVAKANTNYKVVAPGTKSSDTAPLAVTLKGTPEVAVKVTYEAGVVTLANWQDKDGHFYCPLIFKITNGTNTTTVSTANEGINSAETFQNAIKNAIEKVSATYAPNTDLATATDHGLKVTWEWPFETGDTDEEKAANNIKDTYLGDMAAKGGVGVPTVTLGVTATVTQVD